MTTKNHMALWFLWFLWFLRVECSSNPLYKPLCAFLVFVVLVWFLCGRICGFWSRVVFASGLRVRSTSCGFCGSVVLPASSMPMIARPIHIMWFLWIGGLARPLDEGSCVFCASDCHRCAPTCPRPLWFCGSFGLLKRFAHCPTSCYVPSRRHGGDLYKWRKRSWLERP